MPWGLVWVTKHRRGGKSLIRPIRSGRRWPIARGAIQVRSLRVRPRWEWCRCPHRSKRPKRATGCRSGVQVAATHATKCDPPTAAGHIPLLQLARKHRAIRKTHRSALLAVDPKIRLTTLLNCTRSVRPVRATGPKESACAGLFGYSPSVSCRSSLALLGSVRVYIIETLVRPCSTGASTPS
jgi:hypothetical protein